MVRPQTRYYGGGEGSIDDDRAIIKRAFDTLSLDAQLEKEANWIEGALSTIRLEICGSCQYGRPCEDAFWYLRVEHIPSVTLLRLPIAIRQKIYHYLAMESSFSLEWRPVVKYARYGLSIDLLLIHKQITSELVQYITAKNIFNVVVGHHNLPGTILTPLHKIGGLIPPPTQFLTRLNLILEVDLDSLFRPAYQTVELTEIQDETIFGAITSLSEMIRATNFPNLKRISLSIYEIIPLTKRIHMTCSINERDVQKQYANIIQPLLSLLILEGIWVEDIDVVYGDGYTLQGTDPRQWERAEDYIMLWQVVLSSSGIHSSLPQLQQRYDCEEPYAWYFDILTYYFPSITSEDQTKTLTATTLFSSLTPTRAPQFLPTPFKPHKHFPSTPLSPILSPLKYSPPASTTSRTLKPRKQPRAATIPKSSGSLRRYWSEGTSVLTRRSSRTTSTPTTSTTATTASTINTTTNTPRPQLTKFGESLLLPPSRTRPNATLNRAKSTGTAADDSGKSSIRSVEERSSSNHGGGLGPGKSLSKTSGGTNLKNWFTEGASYTRETLSGVRGGEGSRERSGSRAGKGKGEKDRWSIW